MSKKVSVVFGMVLCCVVWFALPAETQEPYGGHGEGSSGDHIPAKDSSSPLPSVRIMMRNPGRVRAFPNLNSLPSVVRCGGFGRLVRAMVRARVGVSGNVGSPWR